MKKLAEEDPDIVTEVYEPKIEEYLARLTGPENASDDRYEDYSFDMAQLQRSVSNANLQQTIEYIGPEKFDSFGADFDIGAYSGGAAAAGD
jgi:ribonucleoside-diphosphate reductase beta chain